MQPLTPRTGPRLVAMATLSLLGVAALLATGCEDTRTLPGEADPTTDTVVGIEDALEPTVDTADPVELDTETPSDATADASDSGPSDTEVDGRDPEDAEPRDTADAPEVDAERDVTEPPDLPPLAPRACTAEFTFVSPPGTTSVSVPGEANAWDTSGWSLTDDDGDGIWTGSFDTSALAPGGYAYKLHINATDWIFDPSTTLRKFDGDFENSMFYVDDCALPSFEVESVEVDAASGGLDVVVAVRDGVSAAGLNDASASVQAHFQEVLGGSGPYDAQWDADSQRFYISASGLAAGKHTLTFSIGNSAGTAEPLWLPVWLETSPFDWRDSVLYFAFVDRFRDGLPMSAPSCAPEGNLANWIGGDWVGLRQKVEEGYFDELGVTAIWINAPNDNPDSCMGGDLPGVSYTAYHGYFPSSNTEAEERFGGLQALRDFIEAAHARGIRVIADLVLNHVHDSHPLVSSQPDWFNPTCQCGVECDWNELPEVCWFQSYLPDYDFRVHAASELASEMAVFWAREADLDGYRVDAVKHVHIHALNTLRYKLDRLAEPSGSHFYTVGETFVGDWGGGGGSEETLIKKYVAPTLLDGQFDFPLYWKMVRGFARYSEPLSSVGNYLLESENYYGSQSIMSTFLGNHDIPRFSSHADGHFADEWGNGSKELWLSGPPGQASNPVVYERLRLGFSFLFCITGVPLIYYGDEIGLAGAGDPDNRRAMPWEGWTAEQTATRSHIGELATIRRNHPALARGTTKLLAATDDTLVVERTWAGQSVVCAFNRSDAPADFSVIPPSAWSGAAPTDALGSAAITGTSPLSFTLPPRSAAIMAP